MSDNMSVDKDRFEGLEKVVHDIDKRMVHMEVAIPSIDRNLEKMSTVLESLAAQNEWNKNTERKQVKTDESIDKLTSKIESNRDKIIRIVIYLAAGGAVGAAGASKLLGL